MKNTIIALVFFLTTTAAIAQDGYYQAPPKLKFSAGAEAGVNSTGNSFTSYMRYGGKAGMLANLAIHKRLDIRTGLYYSMKGATNKATDLWSGDWSAEGDGGSILVKQRINYLELPLSLLLRVGHKRNLYFGPGAYIAYGVTAKATYREDNDVEYSRNIFKPYDGPYYGTRPAVYNRLDYGLLATVGYRLPLGIFVQGQMSWGAANIVANNSKERTTNHGYSITAGWLLNGN